MTRSTEAKRVALVTGANQGLGFALVKGLGGTLGPEDLVYLTARSAAKGEAALAAIGATTAELRFEPLDVSDDANVTALAATIHARHGGIDIVISNAAARISKDMPAAQQVVGFVETNNHGTYRMLKHFMPLLRADARFVVIASAFGRLTHLRPHLHRHFNVSSASLEAIEASMDHYAAAVQSGSAADEGWPEWINIPSKIGQVAAVRVAARQLRAERPGAGILVNAACPGLVDTEASRPWFGDMSRARSPDEAAGDLLWLALLAAGTKEPQGELVQHRKVLSWT